MPFVLLYFLAGLTAVSLIRAEQVERERSGFAASLSPRWVGTIFATSLLVVATAAILAALLSGDTLALALAVAVPCTYGDIGRSSRGTWHSFLSGIPIIRSL